MGRKKAANRQLCASEHTLLNSQTYSWRQTCLKRKTDIETNLKMKTPLLLSLFIEFFHKFLYHSFTIVIIVVVAVAVAVATADVCLFIYYSDQLLYGMTNILFLLFLSLLRGYWTETKKIVLIVDYEPSPLVEKKSCLVMTIIIKLLMMLISSNDFQFMIWVFLQWFQKGGSALLLFFFDMNL